MTNQGRHVSSVHLSAGDVLLGLRHGAHLEALWTSGTGTHDGGQSHRARFHLPHPIELLLQEGRPEITGTHISLSAPPAGALVRPRITCAGSTALRYQV